MRITCSERHWGKAGTSRTAHRDSSSGFTLIELLLVVVILGILIALAIPNYFSMTNRAKESSVKGNAHSAQLATEDYAIRNDGIHPTPAQLSDPSLWPGGVGLPRNPFTGTAMTIAAPGFSQGNLGFQVIGEEYAIEGYGYDAASGPLGNGVLVILTNG